MAFRFAAAAFAALVLATAIFFARMRDNDESGGAVKGSPRLPTSVLPRHYNLRLKPDLQACVFDGDLSVDVEVVEGVDEIIINAADLKVRDGSVSFRPTGSSQVLKPATLDLVTDHEILVMKFKEALPVGQGTLSMSFEGTLNDQMKGFYRSSYSVGDEKRNMAVTQFEPADARRCFPSWDEPSFKATFKIVIEAPADRVVLSNMPVENEKMSGDSKVVEFQVTPIMSTYLVAVVVGELSYLEGTTRDGTSVRVYTLPGKAELGKFALGVAVETLPFYTEYFETPYPLPKMDMVAIPDFAAGAMENYGLVTYRETALLFDEKHSAAANKQRVAVVVTHELAHQWFGNLVTMEWWTHLWLNEGFATWVSYLAADYLFPEWKVWTQFNELTVDAYRLDGLVESHPIEVEVGHVREIDEIFDAISYKKGASIIRMLQTYLCAKTFQKGLASYIKKFAYRNAATEDLWDSLSSESGQPVKELMNSWTKQKGYPVLAVKLVGDALELHQSQFLSTGQPGFGEWVIPLTLCCNSYDSYKTSLVRGTSARIPISHEVDTKSKGKWIKLNVGQTGFYRVQYDDHLAASLRSAISGGYLQPDDRFGVLDDIYALCKACREPMRVLLSLMEAYSAEADPAVLGHLITVSRGVSWILADAIPAVAEDTKGFLSRLLLAPAKNVGWDAVPGESDLVSMLRGDLMLALVLFGHEPTVIEAKERFYEFLKDRNTSRLPADIRKAAYSAVMRSVTAADKSGYDALLQIYRETDLGQERTRILSCLAASSDTEVVREALNLILTDEVRNQDAFFVLGGVRREGRETAWSWLKENWSLLRSRWGDSGFLISRFVTTTTSFSSQEKADEIEEFFRQHGMLAIERTVSQCVERVRINARWVEFIREEEGFKELISELALP
ncbi:aminopeptidase M1 isoform X1 [Selaginella moellendorffii]|uniref:aminopeptidase M1 isoform X1 n=2 Tax=Selaginella moellendorffii TaxID=88036 RepID=UPI000D1D0B3C|nr:aminopeptidase M1 isoform X1 [Selaginella moellendorffii]|eukprot:XP_024545712.1 aminopeptidase M1 isoform X1 [Selaginella moellendorffii]